MTQPPKAQKRPSPLSIRFTEVERRLLTDRAGDQPLSTYLKCVLFENNTSAVAAPQLARILAALGESRLANNIALLAEAANSGSIIEDEATKLRLNQACDNIRAIRELLVCALNPDSGVSQ